MASISYTELVSPFIDTTMTTKTAKDQPIEFRLRYPRPKAEEVCAFNELIEKVIVNDDVLAEEAEALKEVTVEGNVGGLDEIEQEVEREKKRKEEEVRPEEVDSQTCL